MRNTPQATGRLDAAVKPPPKVADVAALHSAGLEDELDRACAEANPGGREAAMPNPITAQYAASPLGPHIEAQWCGVSEFLRLP
ncbi:MAG: hypothetical protein M1608_03815 [Candidatus Omnitrophica bacterium]|nr:hypothetical protein [Candidatus Omnitrophota bacterium]